jgi:hypothetical protein
MMMNVVMLVNVTVNANPSNDEIQTSSSSRGPRFRESGGNGGKGISLYFAMLAPLLLVDHVVCVV